MVTGTFAKNFPIGFYIPHKGKSQTSDLIRIDLEPGILLLAIGRILTKTIIIYL